MSYPEKFTGYAALNKEDGQNLDVKPYTFSPRQWTEDDVDVKISHCSICGSCIHSLRSGWGESKYPHVAGHEIVGEVVKAGSRSGHKVGERVGIGAQGGSCLECKYCKMDRPMYCDKGMLGTYQGAYGDGVWAQGGYASHTRQRGAFAVKIPEALSSEQAAPMMCAGITTFSPLKRFGAGPGKKVAVVGIGGLGHFGLQWASAMGAETFAISHSDKKKHDAEELGVKPENFIINTNNEEVVKKWSKTFDIILVTSFAKDVPLDSLYFPLLAPEGTVCLVGLPEDKLPSFAPGALVRKGISLAGSIIGGPGQIAECLDFAVKHNVKAWIEKRPMDQIDATLKAMHNGDARYRFVMCN